MENFIQQLINGLVIGHAYALIAIGWTILLGVARLVNFGHGELYMLGAFTTWWAISAYDIPYGLAILISMVIGGLIGFLMQLIMLRLTFRKDLIAIMIVTLGFGKVISGVASLLFGANGEILQTPLSSVDLYWNDLWFTYQDIAIVITALLMYGLTWLIIQYTRIGRMARMVAEDPPLAALYGINARLAYFLIFAFEGVAVTLAAAMVAPRSPILTSMGFDETIITFIVVIIGGIGNVLGNYIAALLLGIFIAFFSTYISAAFATAAAFVVLIVLLIAQPNRLQA
ncbi:branched-chain amino acid ABC transporter permease [Castellaniella sp.]|uniref:branched-chain amino acid ABC transporter permease n=1 Tax=Castellaniella sp. TaxID=1955812 RepID=UPI00355D521B